MYSSKQAVWRRHPESSNRNFLKKKIKQTPNDLKNEDDTNALTVGLGVKR